MNGFIKTTITTFGIMASIVSAEAQNPIIRTQFSADPTARLFNGKIYLYPSHDIKPPVGQRQDWFCMEDYHVFSSENLIDWTDHGMIVTQNKVPWVRPDSYSMWAPDCICRNGKYYFYFPSAPAAGGGFAVGVAIADNPEGPFIPQPEPIKGINGIDPCVLQASDGNAYIFWGAGRCAKLKENMTELADDNPRETMRWGNREIESVGVNCLQGMPSRQAEGPFAFEYNGNYYLTYPYVRENTEVLAYGMSKNPMGPYEYKGLIMAEHANGCWTNHHSIVNYKGQWYLFYHHNDYSPKFDKNRSVCVDSLFFNPDGTIQEVKPTLRGVGISNASKPIQIDRYSDIGGGARIEYLDTLDYFKGWSTVLPKEGAWVTYNKVKVADKAATSVTLCYRSNAATTATLQVGAQYKELLKLPATNGQWKETTLKVKSIKPDVYDLKFTAAGAIDVDWICMK